MSTTTIDVPQRAGALTVASTRVHWSVYSVLFASTSVLVGVLWDISWHQTIGRDTFWTPAHLAIYLGGIVAGLTCGWIALRATFAGTDAERAGMVRFWGFSAPFGAWVCIWGTFAMLTSAPFDDWWHNTYGLDVKILSPPHAVLAAGIGAIQVGAMLMALAWQNRSQTRESRLQLLFIYGAGLLLLNVATVSLEYLQRWDMHRSLFFQVACGVFPFLLVSSARASTSKWAATLVAATYMLVTYAMLWILPLFEGRPLLGPIYVPLDRFLPPDPPLMLIAPALAIDMLMQQFRSDGRLRRVSALSDPWRDWALAALIAVAFFAVFVAVQWLFADFLMSSWSHNWVFGTHRMAYMVPPQAQARWTRFNPSDNLRAGLQIALVLAFVSARLGLWRGKWMSQVQR